MTHRYLVYDKITDTDRWASGLMIDWAFVSFVHAYQPMNDVEDDGRACGHFSVIGLVSGDSFVLDMPLSEAYKYFEDARKSIYLHRLN